MVLTQSGKLCHLHDPGRLKELIYPGNKILVREVNGNKRKTLCQVTAVWNNLWVVVDSSIHNDTAKKIFT